jgi:hypothetical protein
MKENGRGNESDRNHGKSDPDDPLVGRLQKHLRDKSKTQAEAKVIIPFQRFFSSILIPSLRKIRPRLASN